MPTYLYAEATPLKGEDDPPEGELMHQGCLRWRLYIHKTDPLINTTHPTQTRSLRGNNDCKAAIDKWGLVNYVTKAMN